MARPKKTGLDYYYKSVHDMDDFRVMDLMEKYGADGYVVLDMTMSCIYRNGYYLEMPVKRLALYIYRYIAGTTSKTSDDVAEIILYCGELGLFDRELLDQSVLTSREIQEHYKSKSWLLPVENDESCVETENNKIPEKTMVFAAKTCVNAAETSVFEDNYHFNSVITPQSKEKQSKEKQSKEKQSKENETKQNESKAKQTKAEQNVRMSADEIFCVPEYADAYAAADAADAYAAADAAAAGSGYEYADAYAADTDAGYGEIENVYLSLTGKKLNGTDKAFIDEIKKEGAYNGLIIHALKKVATRKKEQKINSFRYFMPMIRDMLKERENAQDSFSGNQTPCDDGFIHSDTAYEDPYAHCTTTEEYLAMLDRECKAVPGW